MSKGKKSGYYGTVLSTKDIKEVRQAADKVLERLDDPLKKGRFVYGKNEKKKS